MNKIYTACLITLYQFLTTDLILGRASEIR